MFAGMNQQQPSFNTGGASAAPSFGQPGGAQNIGGGFGGF